MGVEFDRLRKQLITQKQKVDADIKLDKENISHLQKELSLKVKRSNNLQSRIDNIKSGDIEITEHAMLRYFERVCGFDLELIKQGIISESLKAKASVLGSSFEAKLDGYSVVVKNNKVVTIK